MENFQIAFKSIQLLKLMKVQQRGAQISSGWTFGSLPHCDWSSFPSGTQQMLHHHIKDLCPVKRLLQSTCSQGSWALRHKSSPTLYMPCPISGTGMMPMVFSFGGKQMDPVGELSEVSREKDKKYMPACSILRHSYWWLEKDHKASLGSQKDRKRQFQLLVRQKHSKIYLQPRLDTQSSEAMPPCVYLIKKM